MKVYKSIECELEPENQEAMLRTVNDQKEEDERFIDPAQKLQAEKDFKYASKINIELHSMKLHNAEQPKTQGRWEFENQHDNSCEDNNNLQNNTQIRHIATSLQEKEDFLTNSQQLKQTLEHNKSMASQKINEQSLLGWLWNLFSGGGGNEGQHKTAKASIKTYDQKAFSKIVFLQYGIACNQNNKYYRFFSYDDNTLDKELSGNITELQDHFNIPAKIV
jgi:hypothetical protein